MYISACSEHLQMLPIPMGDKQLLYIFVGFLTLLNAVTIFYYAVFSLYPLWTLHSKAEVSPPTGSEQHQ